MILVVDHYDSFTYNLVQLIESLGRSTTVVKSDAKPAAELVAMKPDAVVLSPGPGHPRDVGTFTELLELLPDPTPVLGVCLGHQAIGEAYGGRVVRASRAVHGKTSRISHDGSELFAGLPSPLQVGRYHSLTVERATLPDSLRVVATAENDESEIHALRHRTHPVWGVQFHPESVLTPDGKQLLRNFLGLVAR